MSYKKKFIKYKTKYFNLKNQIGGKVGENYTFTITKELIVSNTKYLDKDKFFFFEVSEKPVINQQIEGKRINKPDNSIVYVTDITDRSIIRKIKNDELDIKPIVELVEKDDIFFYKIKNSVFTTLCNRLNIFYNKFADTKFHGPYALGGWEYVHNNSSISQNIPTFGSDTSKKRSNIFITREIDLIKDCLHYFVELIKEKFPDFKFNEFSNFRIDVRSHRLPEYQLHQDGDDLFILFIYPKTEPIATAICSYQQCNKFTEFKGDRSLEPLDLDEKSCPENMKIIPTINQCDAIMLQNTKVYHCTPNSFSSDNSNSENLSFIRISMKKI